MDQVLTFNVDSVNDTYQYDIDYDYYFGPYDHYCLSPNDRYLYIGQDLNASLFRNNMTVRLVQSPLYDAINFTAVCQNGEWTYTTEDSSNHHTSFEAYTDEYSWQVYIRDSLCVPGYYKFVVTTACGIDTIDFIVHGNYNDSIALVSPPEYEMTPLCDRVVVHHTSTVVNYYTNYIGKYRI